MKDAGYLEVIFLNFISDFLSVRSALPIDGRRIAALILKTECYYVRYYIDATMHLASLGNAVQYSSVCNFQIVFLGLFILLTPHCLITQNDLVHRQAMRIIKELLINSLLRAAFCLFMKTLLLCTMHTPVSCPPFLLGKTCDAPDDNGMGGSS
jgi:hypothetical protein